MLTDTKVQTKPVTYYGKKAYRLNPMLARLKIPEKKLPNFWDEDIKNKPRERKPD